MMNLPCSALVTNAERVILDVNNYFLKSFVGIKASLLAVMSKASNIFYQSYLIPTLLHEKHCEEMQLSIVDRSGTHIPVTVNAKIGVNKNIY
jgi:hypothetical protein